MKNRPQDGLRNAEQDNTLPSLPTSVSSLVTNAPHTCESLCDWADQHEQRFPLRKHAAASFDSEAKHQQCQALGEHCLDWKECVKGADPKSKSRRENPKNNLFWQEQDEGGIKISALSIGFSSARAKCTFTATI